MEQCTGVHRCGMLVDLTQEAGPLHFSNMTNVQLAVVDFMTVSHRRF